MIRAPLRRAAALALIALTPAVALAQELKLEGNALVVPGPVVYETGGDRIKPESEPVLDHVKRYLDAKDYITLMRIEVHTDNTGSADASQALSVNAALRGRLIGGMSADGGGKVAGDPCK